MSRYSAKAKRVLALLLSFVMLVSVISVAPGTTSQAAAKKVVKSLSVSKSKVTLEVDKNTTLKATLKATKKVSKTDLKVTVKSNKTSVAKVSNIKNPTKKAASGVTSFKVTGRKAGTAKITVTAKNKNAKGKTVKKTISVTVKDKGQPATQQPVTPQPVTPQPSTEQQVLSVTFDKAVYTVEAGKSVMAAATALPLNAKDRSLTFSSSKEEVAVITDAGVIVGVSAGEATITAKAKNGVSGTAKVTVTNPVSVTLSNDKLSLGKGETANLTASVPGVTWTSSDEAVATVTQNGVVTAIAPGTAKIIASFNGVSAFCEVTVSQYDPENDGITLNVFNPIKNNDNQVIENTVLINQDMTIQAYVQNDSTPSVGSRVKLKLESIASKVVSKEDFVIKVNGNETDTAVTNENGIAEFTVSYKGNIASSYQKFAECPYQSFAATAEVDNNPGEGYLTVKFASVLVQGIQVDNNRYVDYDNIIPFDGHASGDNGIWVTQNTNNYFTDEYVSSQQVGNTVYLSATPYFILPPEKTASEAKFYVDFPGKEVTSGQEDVEVVGNGVTQTYSIYNDEDDMTTTTTIVNIPAGLVSMSVQFNKISISKYSQLYVDLYEYTGSAQNPKGKRIDGWKSSDTEGEYSTSRGVSLSKVNTMKNNGILIVSIKSPGQVELSATGYSLDYVTGDFTTTGRGLPQQIEVKDSVVWKNVSQYVKYEVGETLTYAQAAQYLKEYVGVENSYLVDNKNYTFSYRVPVFNSNADNANAVAGNALITATYKAINGTTKTATYAYPTVKDAKENKNVLVAKTDNVKAVFLGNDVLDANGDIKQETGTLSQDGNQAVIASQTKDKSGVINLEAKIKIDALNNEIKMAANDYDKSPVHGANEKFPLYSYVQFVARPKEAEADGIVPDFFAVEDQLMVVSAEVLADNGEEQTAEAIDFYYKDASGEKVKITSDLVNKEIGTKVRVKYIDDKTNSDGRAYLVLEGTDEAKLENLFVEYGGDFKTLNTYVGNSKFDEIKQGSEKVRTCNLYWVDLGLAYLDDVTNPKWTVNMSSMPANVSSKSVVDTEWKVGFLPVAKCFGFFDADYNPDLENNNNLGRYAANKFMDISNVSVEYAFEGENKENATAGNGAAVIKSSKTGNTVVYGTPKLAADAVQITYFDDIKQKKTITTVGVNSFNVNNRDINAAIDLGGKINYTMTWTVSNWSWTWFYPYGSNLNINTKSMIYFRLHDKNGNPVKEGDLEGKKITFKANGDEILGEYVPDDNGIISISLEAPGRETELDITATISDLLDAHSQTIKFTDTDAPALSIVSVDDKALDTLEIEFSNELNEAVKGMSQELLKKLFTVKAADGRNENIDSIVVGVKTVTIKLAVPLTTKEKYTVAVTTDGEAKDGYGVAYVVYDNYGQTISEADASKEITMK